MRNSKTQRYVVVKRMRALTVRCASVCIEHMKWLAFLLLVFVFVAATSCTTLVNRRDLYSPEPGPDSLEAARQWYGGTTMSDDDNPNTKRSGRDRGPGLSLLETKQKAAIMAVVARASRTQKACRLGRLCERIRQGCASYVLAERKIRLYSRHICVVNARCFAQPAFAL